MAAIAVTLTVSTMPYFFFQVVQQQVCLSIAKLLARCCEFVHTYVIITKSFWKLKKNIKRNFRSCLFLILVDMQLLSVIYFVCFLVTV